MRMYRQGDVLILEVDREANRSVLRSQLAKDKVLVYGESTGHAHRVDGETARVIQFGETKFVDAPDGFKLVHEEHDTIEVPEGFYRVVRQREYDEKEIRYVAD